MGREALMIVFIDIDGTIADASARLPFVMGPGKKNWDAFHDPGLVAADPPITAAREALDAIFTDTDLFTPIIMTGRPARLRSVTEEWLVKHFNIDTTAAVGHQPLHSRPAREAAPLLMRPDKDYSSSVEYKRRQLSETLDCYPNDLAMFIDDDLRNKEMYLAFGIFVHAPACWGVVHF
jgi:hypothetical protein